MDSFLVCTERPLMSGENLAPNRLPKGPLEFFIFDCRLYNVPGGGSQLAAAG